MNPSGDHLTTMKWILRYLRDTSNYSLSYGPMGLEYIGFVDVDFAGDRDKKHSTMGYIFSTVDSIVSYESKLQLIVALSMIKVEYIAAVHVCKEAIWLSTSRKVSRISDSLFSIKQGEIEMLRDFVTRFNTATLEVRDLNEDMAISP
ncbi:secreted RxLR effector protein 161-like [Elaeis guineensis]|uniref:secreted RxLR effector protein 161-like n=1 Tax=Elaeis guineensis var. tenera TaxID=51953 RepID=UPI003C6D4E23